MTPPPLSCSAVVLQRGYYTRSTGGDAVAYNAPCSPRRNRTPLALGCSKKVSTRPKQLATRCCCSVPYDRLFATFLVTIGLRECFQNAPRVRHSQGTRRSSVRRTNMRSVGRQKRSGGFGRRRGRKQQPTKKTGLSGGRLENIPGPGLASLLLEPYSASAAGFEEAPRASQREHATLAVVGGREDVGAAGAEEHRVHGPAVAAPHPHAVGAAGPPVLQLDGALRGAAQDVVLAPDHVDAGPVQLRLVAEGLDGGVPHAQRACGARGAGRLGGAVHGCIGREGPSKACSRAAGQGRWGGTQNQRSFFSGET